MLDVVQNEAGAFFRDILHVDANSKVIEKARQLCDFYSTLAKTNKFSQCVSLSDCEIDTLNPQEITQLLVTRSSLIGDKIPDMRVNADIVEFVLTQYAPRALLNGALLQNSSNAANSHETIAAILHRLHGVQVGNGNLVKNKNILFQQMLQSLGVFLSDISSSNFSENTNIHSCAWPIPVYHLSLSLRPSEMLPEILGTLLFDVMSSIPMIVRRLEQHIAGLGGFTGYYLTKMTDDQGYLLACAKLAIESYLSAFTERQHLCNRIVNGINISYQLQSDWSSDLIKIIQSSYFTPHSKMVRLIKRKGKYSIGYHSLLKLNGLNFDKVILEDAEAFVSALGQSRWISPGHPEKSTLTTKLVEFGGPMFRVFTPDELQIMNEWIQSLLNEAIHGYPSNTDEHVSTHLPVVNSVSSSQPQIEFKYQRISLRDMYYYLVNIERHPDILQYAKKFAINWLSRSAINLFRGERAIPFTEYAHQNLRTWYDAQAEAQVYSYIHSSHEVLKTRAQVIDEAVQLCPMILIDGSWLQKWCSSPLVDTKIGTLLYKIYSDEVGNGEPELNHPNIYRNLMQEMGINLPKFATREFSYWDRFNDEAFKVPVFWLSISQFPRRFMAETLGLNLAMELAGVGGSYRTARDELHHYGYSTRFVDLHNTIDNVSTGHTAMARQAIEHYMDSVLQTNNPVSLRSHWERVWIGYRALMPPKNTWKTLFARRKEYQDCQNVV